MNAKLAWLDGDQGTTLAASGSWTMSNAAQILLDVQALSHRPTAIDLGSIEALDSAGALLLLGLVDDVKGEPPGLSQMQNARGAQQALLGLVAEHRHEAAPTERQQPSAHQRVEAFGKRIASLAEQSHALAIFFGEIMHCFWAILIGKRKFRVTSVIHHMERTGLDAVPIVALLCFLVGAVVAFLSATALEDFGAAILTVDIVTVSFLREFGVLLTAILVAGRSGSAFTAEIGSMRSREEVDAMKALALDPIELLVIPRLTALLLTLPMLAFIATLAGILGGILVGASALEISPAMFLARMHDTELYYLWLGLMKAPVFAFLIAAIGCSEGLKVSGSAESVGLHTTASVVQSIFLVIVFDALFAVLFMQLDL